MRVHDFILKCVGFVGEVAHRDATGVSGDLHATGFFISVPAESPELKAVGAVSVYFVTAKHVATDLANRDVYFLVNKRDGGTIAIDSAGILGHKWWFHPTDPTADVAIAPIRENRDADIVSVAVEQLGTHERLKALDIGVGDETFSTGLFTPAPGTSQNVPVVRYGNIAMMAGEEMQTELGYASVHLVEARSIGGLSGSPVFVRPTIDFIATDRRYSKPRHAFAPGLGYTLLGLMHGHWDIKESEMNKPFFTHDRKHGVNLGIGIVVPANKILETINGEELMEVRREAEKHEKRRAAQVPGMDSAKARSDERAFTQSDFEVALKKASRKVAPKKA